MRITHSTDGTLNASGHISSTTNDEASERALAAVLARAIEDLSPLDISSCTFNGNFVRGDLRTMDLETRSDDSG